MQIIYYAIPGFFILIAIELLVDKIRGTQHYRMNDTITSLTTGMFNQSVEIIKKLVPFTIYLFIYDHLALVELPTTPLVWVIAFVLYDFFYYWNHRLGHEVNILWAAHVVHHSSEDYNLATALRQTSSGFLSVFFYIPMALMGFDPLMVISVGALNLVYQFWVHTQHIDKLGWYEWVFVTPSNHRGHHAQNAVYIDRNYGGVFILWDRLFGSYQEELEQDPPIYGIRGAIKTWNPVWTNLHFYHQLWQDCQHTNSWLYKLTIWFRRTGWRPPDVVDRYPLLKTDLDDFTKFDIPMSSSDKFYSFLQYLSTTVVLLGMLVNLQNLATNYQLALIAYTVFAGYSVGTFMQRQRYAKLSEGIKNCFLLVAIISLQPSLQLPLFMVLILSLIAVVSLIMLMQNRSIDLDNKVEVNHTV